MSAKNKNAYWFIFQNDQLLITENTGENILLTTNLIERFKQYFFHQNKLIQLEQYAVYCAELPNDIHLPESIQTIPLRKGLDLLGSDWYTTAAKAFSIINWERNHQFCGRCGQATIKSTALFERHCTHCNLNFYPRISPSIIVLIQNGDQVLMARSPHFPPGAYALIAGFVEAGESIEDAVHREVQEEVGLKIKNLRYFQSQAWPFPDSLMIGFFADYESGELTIDRTELEDAGWYRYDKLPGRPSSNISIGSKMLDDYISQQREKSLK